MTSKLQYLFLSKIIKWQGTDFLVFKINPSPNIHLYLDVYMLVFTLLTWDKLEGLSISPLLGAYYCRPLFLGMVCHLCLDISFHFTLLAFSLPFTYIMFLPNVFFITFLPFFDPYFSLVECSNLSLLGECSHFFFFCPSILFSEAFGFSVCCDPLSLSYFEQALCSAQ